jgi:hypothetical protein
MFVVGSEVSSWSGSLVSLTSDGFWGGRRKFAGLNFRRPRKPSEVKRRPSVAVCWLTSDGFTRPLEVNKLPTVLVLSRRKLKISDDLGPTSKLPTP